MIRHRRKVVSDLWWVTLSFAKTGAALLSVTIATVSGVGRPDGRGGWHGWRSEAPCVRRTSAAGDVHRAADEVTSGGAPLVTVVQAADFWECDHVTLGDALHASRRWRVFSPTGGACAIRDSTRDSPSGLDADAVHRTPPRDSGGRTE